MGGVDLLRGLDEAQLTAVTSPGDPVCVMARAGTGKTRVITRRIAWRAEQGSLDVRRVLAITFTTRAAEELRSRLGQLLGRDTGTTGTFHAIALGMIRDHRAEANAAPPVVLDNPRSLLADVTPPRRHRSLGAISAEIAWASARGVAPDAYPQAARSHDRRPPLVPDSMAEVYAAYEDAKRRRGVVDFDDLIIDCVDLLETDAAFAQAQRWRYRHFFVDEYQDVNPIQQRLLDAWLGDRDDLFVVGDPHQAIYGFNGADASFLTQFSARYPHAAVHELTTNHRSAPGIVAVADSVLARKSPPGSSAGPVPCTVTACDDAEDEALTIARALRATHTPGRRWRSQAVLVRTNAQAVPITELLARAGIPVACLDDPPNRDAVRVTSFHSAKGLEWPIVHVAGLEEGFVPDIHARTAEELAEEQRLLYVALTRASQRVHCTWARQRQFGERISERTPSRWVTSIAAVVREVGSAPRLRQRSTSPVTVPMLAPEDSLEDTPRARLVHWRATRARAASVPAAVVFGDQVLDELVRLAPQDEDELRRVPGLGVIKANRYRDDLLDALHPGRNR